MAKIKKANRKISFRRGAATLDAIIGVAIMLSVGVVITQYVKQAKASETITRKKAFLQGFDRASIEAFREIIDAYQKPNSNMSDSDDTWGWDKSPNASMFPAIDTVGGITYVRYDLDSAADSVSDLKKKIASEYRGICSDMSDEVGGGNTVYLYCPLLEDIKYDTSTGATDLNTPFTAGNTLDPDDIPTMKITYKQYDTAEGNYTSEEYHVSYADAYDECKAISAMRMMTIRNLLEDHATATKLKELANTENDDGSGGLNGADDEMVPWHWKSYGDDRTVMDNTFCNKAAGGGECSNLDDDDIWRSAADEARGLIALRVADNFINGDKSYLVDGFGNGIYIHPNGNDCGGSADLSSCAINSPTLPQDDYVDIGKPPYTTYIYIDPYNDTTTKNGSVYGRIIMTY